MDPKQYQEKSKRKSSKQDLPYGSAIQAQIDEEEGSHKTHQRTPEPTHVGASFKWFGSLCLVVGIAAFILSGTSRVDTSVSAQNALQNKVSTAISAGVFLLSADEEIQAQDHTITHSSDSEESQIWVWDFAAEDGDYVQVLVNGASITEPFMIKHKPRTFMVPTTGDVQIKGIKDGGGGITYAVRYDLNGTSYFNGAPEGEFNTYTLVRE